MNEKTRRLCQWYSPILLSLFLPIQNCFALPLIQELYYDHLGSDTPGVFTELYGDPGFSLNGWQLVGINGGTSSTYRTITFLNASIPNDGIFVVSTANANTNLLQESDFSANVDWQNGADAVQLLDPSGLIIDAVQYGSLAGFDFGEGNAAIDTPAGSSLSRRFAAADTDNNLTDFEVLSAPTPGSVRLPSTLFSSATNVPAPNSALLMITALLVISLCRTSPQKLRRRQLLEKPH